MGLGPGKRGNKSAHFCCCCCCDKIDEPPRSIVHRIGFLHASAVCVCVSMAIDDCTFDSVEGLFLAPEKLVFFAVVQGRFRGGGIRRRAFDRATFRAPAGSDATTGPLSVQVIPLASFR